MMNSPHFFTYPCTYIGDILTWSIVWDIWDRVVTPEATPWKVFPPDQCVNKQKDPVGRYTRGGKMKLTNVSQRVCYIYKVVYQNVGTSVLLSSEPKKSSSLLRSGWVRSSRSFTPCPALTHKLLQSYEHKTEEACGSKRGREWWHGGSANDGPAGQDPRQHGRTADWRRICHIHTFTFYM